MADERPMFDDEELPAWLTRAGITHAAKPTEPEPEAQPEAEPPRAPSPLPRGVTSSLPWISGNDQTQTESRPPTLDVPDWMNAPATPEPEATSQVDNAPWLQQSGSADVADLPMPDFDNLGWDQPQQGVTPNSPAAGGLTAMLPWRQGASDEADQPPAADQAWLSQPDTTVQPASDDLFAGLTASTPPPPPTPTAPEPEAPAGPRGLKDRLNKLPATNEPPAGLTYEQWEQRESARKPAPPTISPAAAPPPQAAPEPASADLPDWLSGLPAPEAEAAPVSDSAIDFDKLFSDMSTSAPPPELAPTSTASATSDEGSLLDWMSDLPDYAEPESSPAAAPAAEMPDWLSSAAPSEAQAVPGASADDDWLSGFGAAAPEPETPAAAAPGSQADIPDWMRDMAPAPPTPIAESQSSIDEDWLKDLAAAPSAPATPEAVSETPGGDLPDWLSSMKPEAAAPRIDLSDLDFDAIPGTPAESPAPLPIPAPSRPGAKLDLTTVNSSDIDALLNMPVPTPASAPEPAEQPAATLDSMASVGSFDDFDLDRVLGPADSPPAAPSASTAPPMESPTQKMRSTGLMARVTPPDEAAAPAKPEQPARPGRRGQTAPPKGQAPALPDYVADLRPTDEPVPLSVGPVQIGIKEAPLAQLTDQLRQLRERAREFQPPQPGPVPTAGPLADIKDTLAVEPIIIQASSQVVAAPQSAVSDMQAKRVRLIQDLLELDEPQSSAKSAAKTTRRARPKADRLLISLVLLLALVGPFLTDAVNLMGPPDTANLTAAQSAVFGTMDRFAAGQTVLVAFEYGPTGSGELDDLARVMLHDLFKQGAKPIIVSTNPSGALHAESLLAVFGRNADELGALNRADKPLLARTDYVVLRYLPAGAAGVRSVLNAVYQDPNSFESQSQFVTDIEGRASGLSDTDVRALSKVPAIVLAETSEDVRNWAEQYRAPAVASGQPPRFILAASAAADATARSYSASLPGVIIGPLIGLRDATVYRTVRQPTSKASDAKILSQRWQSTGLAALVSGLIIFLGMAFNLIRALRRPRTQGARR